MCWVSLSLSFSWEASTEVIMLFAQPNAEYHGPDITQTITSNGNCLLHSLTVKKTNLLTGKWNDSPCSLFSHISSCDGSVEAVRIRTSGQTRRFGANFIYSSKGVNWVSGVSIEYWGCQLSIGGVNWVSGCQLSIEGCRGEHQECHRPPLGCSGFRWL